LIPWLSGNQAFPPIERALRRPSGLLAAGGDLSPERLLAAYRQGIFPWYCEGEPILWWSPDPRMVLFPDELRVTRSLAKRLRNAGFEVTADRAFEQVIEHCSEPRPGQPGTWITAQMKQAYTRLHRLGYAHSIETWQQGELVGGLYGIALGRMFFGESMFSRASDASKVALVRLVQHLESLRFGMIDCQMRTALLASLGARAIPRTEFARRLEDLVHYPDSPGPWTLAVPQATPRA
jgi:leucyl/phenylalanyl-tRNA--protein transferase